jgi:4-amino-4-deoxy-L-arabinose transferase-like glycosyltransferase
MNPGWLGLLAVAAAIAVLIVEAFAAARFELSFDEAYYTIWSRALAFGYLDHPPMVALLIRASTEAFGGSEFGVRALSLSLVGVMPALIGFVAWRLFRSAGTAALAALTWIGMPLVLFGAIFVTPDTPLVLLWMLGLLALAELWRSGEPRWLIALGAAIGLALMAKFTAAFLILGVFLAFATTPSLRRWLASRWLYAGLALALAIFAPFVAWNAAHGWATFAKQFGRTPPHGFSPSYLVEFVASQVCLINPLVFAALVLAIAAISWRRKVAPGSPDEARRILVCTIAPAAIYFLLHSLHDRVEGNWPAPLYPALAILSADWAVRIRHASAPPFSRTIAAGLLWAAPVGFAVAAIALVELTTGAIALGPVNPFARLEGYRALARDLDSRARAEGADYVVAQGYALTAMMDYYGEPGLAVIQPEQRIRWISQKSPDETLFAKPGLAIGEAGHYFDLVMKMRFRNVEPLGPLTRRGAGGLTQAYELYRVADPFAPVLDPVCPRGEVNLARQCQP